VGNYAATFFSHYDALIFFNFLKERGETAKLIPVPRKVSASCGTCVAFEISLESDIDFGGHEIEAVYLETSSGFSKIWDSEN